MKNMYDLDIAIEIIARMQARKANELYNTIDQLKRIELQKDIDILRAEKKALYSNILQQSVIDKVFKIYAPILKAESKYVPV